MNSTSCETVLEYARGQWRDAKELFSFLNDSKIPYSDNAGLRTLLRAIVCSNMDH